MERKQSKFSLFSAKQLTIIGTVWLAFLLTFVARLAWSSLMPIAGKALHLTSTQGASLVSAFYIGYAITVLPGGILADRIGYRKVIMGSLIAMAVTTALMGTVTDYNTGFIYRVLLGIACGPMQASCLSAMGDWIPAKIRGTAMGIFITSTSLGITVVNAYAPITAKTYGWQTAFFVTAVLPMLALVLVSFTLKKRKSENDVEIAVETVKAQNQPAGNFIQDFKALAKNRNVIVLAMAGIFTTGATWGVTNWSNKFMVDKLHVTAVQAGVIMSIYGIAAMMSKPISGALTDMFRNKKNRLASVLVFLFAPAILLFATNNDPQMLYVYGPILGIGAFSYSAVTNLLAIEVAPAHMRGTCAGFINLFQQLGSLASPLIVGKIYDVTKDFGYSLSILAIAPVIGAMILLLLKLPKVAK